MSHLEPDPRSKCHSKVRYTLILCLRAAGKPVCSSGHTGKHSGEGWQPTNASSKVSWFLTVKRRWHASFRKSFHLVNELSRTFEPICERNGSEKQPQVKIRGDCAMQTDDVKHHHLPQSSSVHSPWHSLCCIDDCTNNRASPRIS